MQKLPIQVEELYGVAGVRIGDKMNTPRLIRMSYIDRIKEIMKRSYHLLLAQISEKIVIDNEASLQLSSILKVIGELYQISHDDLFTIKLNSILGKRKSNLNGIQFLQSISKGIY